MHLRLMFEWGGGALWCGDDEARDVLGLGPVEDRLPLSTDTRRRLAQLTAWHDTALDWHDPAAPSPWPPAEAERFDRAAAAILEDLRGELGPAFTVAYEPL